MIEIQFLALLILVMLICHIIIELIIFRSWEKKFVTEARKREREAKRTEKPKRKFAIKFWALIQEPIVLFIPLLFIIDGLILRMGILYSPYLSFFNPIDLYLQIMGLIVLFVGFIIYIRSGKMVIQQVYSKATEERRMITTGLYSYIRHPLYLSFILVPVGFLLLTLNYLSLFYFLAFTLFTNSDLKECGREGKFTFITKAARCEEENLRKIYGKDYEKYQEKTGRLLPKLRK